MIDCALPSIVIRSKFATVAALALALTGCDGGRETSASANREFMESILAHSLEQPPSGQYECKFGRHYQSLALFDRIVDIDFDECNATVTHEFLGEIKVGYSLSDGTVISATVLFGRGHAEWMEEQLKSRIGVPSSEVQSISDFLDHKLFSGKTDRLELFIYLDADDDYLHRLYWQDDQSLKRVLAKIPISDLERNISRAKEKCTAELRFGPGYRAARWQEETGPWTFVKFDKEEGQLEFGAYDVELFSERSREWVDGGSITCRYWPNQGFADVKIMSGALMMEQFR